MGENLIARGQRTSCSNAGGLVSAPSDRRRASPVGRQSDPCRFRAELAFSTLDTPMNHDPLATALREIAETRSLLESLLTSSESFDYPNAKAALKQLHRKVRELGRMQARLEKASQVRHPEIRFINFKTGRSAPATVLAAH